MKIAQLITELRPAGAERIVMELSLRLLALGHEVSVISLRPLANRSWIIDRLEDAGIPVASANLGRATPFRLARLRSILDRLRPELVHAHLFHSTLASRLVRPGRNYALVNTVHLSEPRLSKQWLLLLDRWTLPLCTVQTAVSRSVRDFHAARMGASADSMPVILNGVREPDPLPDPERSALRRDWGVADCSRVLGSVGRLAHQKGYDILLDLLPDLGRRIPEGETWGLVILGDGPMASRLARMAARAPENLRVVLPGFRADAPRCIGAFDLFLMPSRYEGFGLTLAEAMAHGVPALISPVPSLVEVLGAYPNGRVTEFVPGREDQVARDIEQLSLPDSARTPVAPFSIETMTDQYLDLYRSLHDPGPG